MQNSEDENPRFLQLYIYDTANEVNNRLAHFDRDSSTTLQPEIVANLIDVLDHNNAMVQLFRTARDKFNEANVPEFKLNLYGVAGAAQYELPTADSIGALVFESGPETSSEFDIVIERYSGDPERVNKLHPCYMALALPLMFVFGEQGYHIGLRLLNPQGVSGDDEKRMSMNAYYSYQLHDRLNRYGLIPERPTHAWKCDRG
ncbi:hypothetical protein CTI12_AA538620 [Artemisia annua]|uniref:Helitron helicase-like domain-containing protein n=1 Tax=Artemisia annua TaxID=35608 RepID=A0A2U1L1Z1_ARTAN|nr:hypothetical protein CTI12_AA538620 [Artemisia annua]